MDLILMSTKMIKLEFWEPIIRKIEKMRLQAKEDEEDLDVINYSILSNYFKIILLKVRDIKMNKFK